MINHERLCKNNPNRQTTPFQNEQFQKSGFKRSNQFIKAVEKGTTLVVSDKTRKILSKNYIENNGYQSEESNLKRIETITNHIRNGTWHCGYYTKRCEHNGIKFDSKWEVVFAIWLDENNIQWIRNKTYFYYEFNGKVRRYFPDFYLKEVDIYVEIKGRITEKDLAKWIYFPKDKKLIVLTGDKLIQLGMSI